MFDGEAFMKSHPLMFTLMALACISLPACGSHRWVNVQMRDAQTHLPLSNGRYEMDQTVIDWPPDIGPPFPFTEHYSGRFHHDGECLSLYPWYKTCVKTEANDCGDNRFTFFVTPWGKEGTIVSDWKRAKLITKDGREIEYKITYPVVGPNCFTSQPESQTKTMP